VVAVMPALSGSRRAPAMRGQMERAACLGAWVGRLHGKRSGTVSSPKENRWVRGVRLQKMA
jgi:hypothetical protein